jgi:hypothetical protein
VVFRGKEREREREREREKREREGGKGEEVTGQTLSLVKGLGMSRRDMTVSPWRKRHRFQRQRSGKRGKGRFGSGEETAEGYLWCCHLETTLSWLFRVDGNLDLLSLQSCL